eukprot:TRINITY_DN705_c0_g1_i2.p1 TRINITY_DN705_c0_g1~~TRINITY_DN705_c0_g1_i2.p1  ORF type:complete len:350 (-),score=45.17 TRINITY_DN705_c0_g1_i2:326-1375(-)
MESRAPELFKSLDDNLICPICWDVMGNPVDTPCQHTYCSKCIIKAIEEGSKQCSKCRTPIKVKSLKPASFVLKSVIYNQTAFCDHKSTENETQCEWSGPWANLESHLKNDCFFEKVSCGFNCWESVLRKDYEHHQLSTCVNRNKACKYCKELVNRLHHQQHHLICPEFRLKCACGGTVARKDFSLHTEEYCPKTVVPCMFWKIGCNHSEERKKMGVHLDDAISHHNALLEAVVSEVNEVKEGLQNKEKEVSAITQNMLKLEKTNLQKIDDLQNEHKGQKEPLEKQVNELQNKLLEQKQDLDWARYYSNCYNSQLNNTTELLKRQKQFGKFLVCIIFALLAVCVYLARRD